MALPDVFVIGAPKAGSTAVHAALASHPAIFMSEPKEPKYFLCGDEPPPPQHGPGDAHSRKEWVWRRDDYEALFDRRARPARCWARARRSTCGTTGAHRADRRGRAPGPAASPSCEIPSTGPTRTGPTFGPTGTSRSATSWPPPSWRTSASPPGGRRSGATSTSVGTARQLEHLHRHFPAEQVHVLRYRELVDEPQRDAGGHRHVPRRRPRRLRAGAGRERLHLGAGHARSTGRCGLPCASAPGPGSSRRRRCGGPPSDRCAPLLRRERPHRPELTPSQRAIVQRHFVDDVGAARRPDRPRLPRLARSGGQGGVLRAQLVGPVGPRGLVVEPQPARRRAARRRSAASRRRGATTAWGPSGRAAKRPSPSATARPVRSSQFSP